MKASLILSSTVWLAAIGVVFSGGWSLQGATTNAPPERIGVYDSRVIAYADFWSEAHQRQINEMVAAANAARTAGDTNRLREVEAVLRQGQERIQLQVFSTAPVDEVLAGMKSRVAAVQQEAGVSRLISKWDEPALEAQRGAVQVDVTDALLRGFKLTDQQKTVIEGMKKKPPVSQEKARELMHKGGR